MLVPSPLPVITACQVGVENEWIWRSSVDKIRAERQDGCRHERRFEEMQRSHSDWFFKHQSRKETVRVRPLLVTLKRAPQ